MVIDPSKIKEKDLPLIVMCDDRRSLVGFLIKNHNKGNYNHIMCLHREGYFASQDPQGYREIPVEAYMKNNIMLKFWSYSNITIEQKRAWFGAISRDLKDPKKANHYDWLGIFGQIIGMPWINNPFINYCSEIEADHYKEALQFKIPTRPTPSGLNNMFKSIPDMKIKGYYFSD